MPDKEKCEKFMSYLHNDVRPDCELSDADVKYIRENYSSIVIINGEVKVMIFNKKNRPVFSKVK